MANIDINGILKSIEDQTKTLAGTLFKQYTQQAVADVKDFLQKSKDDLERWTLELVNKQIDADEYRSLVRGQLDVAEMRALKQAGLAQVQIDTFTSGVLDIVVKAAMAAIP
jgi:ABC-type phosphate transport system auxiliary subunit